VPKIQIEGWQETQLECHRLARSAAESSGSDDLNQIAKRSRVCLLRMKNPKTAPPYDTK